jgi:hypothetical protein
MIPPRANVYAMIIFLFIFFVTVIVKGKTIFYPFLIFFRYFILTILSYFSNIFFFLSFFIIVSHSHCVIDADCPRNMCGFHFPPRCEEGDCVC